jgi:hypothetical protein
LPASVTSGAKEKVPTGGEPTLFEAGTDPVSSGRTDSRKKSEGKTHAKLRCLKRHLARRIWHLLRAPPRSVYATAASRPTSLRRRRVGRVLADQGRVGCVPTGDESRRWDDGQGGFQ